MLIVISSLNLLATLSGLGMLWLIRKTLMATQAELAQSLRDLKAQNDKAAAEQAAALAALEAALAQAGATTPEVDAALADLKASIQAEDDLNPDTPADPAPV